jgi:hypothetical protein
LDPSSREPYIIVQPEVSVPQGVSVDPDLFDPVAFSSQTLDPLAESPSRRGSREWPTFPAGNLSAKQQAWARQVAEFQAAWARFGGWEEFLPAESYWLGRLWDERQHLLPLTHGWLIHIPLELDPEHLRPLIVMTSGDPPAPGDRLVLRRPWEQDPCMTVTVMWPAHRVEVSRYFLGAATDDGLWFVVED